MFYVPVVDINQQPLMPTTPKKARILIRSGQATPFWKKGVFCVRLNYTPARVYIQDVVVGIDPGSKKEAFTVKSASHTYLNLQADAVTWVKEALKTRREMRRGRRYRKTPCRANRENRRKGGIPPSTKARWQWKLRITNWLSKLFPISHFVVEDIKARTKGQRKWDRSFSPLEVGKSWFYQELSQLAPVETKQGWETKELRDQLRLKKSGNKLSNTFESHCVDSWVLANSQTGGHSVPENTEILCVIPLRFHRRQLHVLQPSKGGVRKPYGGTISIGFKRGSYIKHLRYGVCFVGGTSNGRISLHSLVSGERMTKTAKPEDCRFLTDASFRTWK